MYYALVHNLAKISLSGCGPFETSKTSVLLFHSNLDCAEAAEGGGNVQCNVI